MKPYLKKKVLFGIIEIKAAADPDRPRPHTQRLESYAVLPKGKIPGFFDHTDIYKAKEILGNTMCICGFMPFSPSGRHNRQNKGLCKETH